MHKFATDIGVSRVENQDRGGHWSNEFYSLLVLCDGMGGHYGGAKASDIIVNTFEESFKDLNQLLTKKEIEKWFLDTIKLVKHNMINVAKENPIFKDMGSTVVAALINKTTQKTFILNIGDSRAYSFNKTLRQITLDQNVSNYLIQEEGFSQKQASNLLDSQKLISCVGPNKYAKIDLYILKPSSKLETIILTTDGIHNHIDNVTFELILNNDEFSLEQKALKLIETAKRNGSQDNLSIFIKEFY